jgi:hypothetical protein
MLRGCLVTIILVVISLIAAGRLSTTHLGEPPDGHLAEQVVSPTTRYSYDYRSESHLARLR